MSKRLTMQDVAEEAGVSRAVVSAVLNGKNPSYMNYREETRLKILSAAEKIGYRPNRAARNVCRQRHDCLALVCHNIFQFDRNILHALIELGARQNQIIFVDRALENETGLPRCMVEDMVDGIIVFGEVPRLVEEKLVKIDIPVVWVNHSKEYAPDCIRFDHREAFSRILVECAAQGRQKALWLNVSKYKELQEGMERQMRLQALEEASEKLNMRPPVAMTITLSDALVDGFNEAISKQVDVVIVDDLFVPKVYEAALATGRKIGQDLSVVTINRSWTSKCMNPPTAGISMIPFEVGQAVMDNILSQIKGEATAAITLPYIWNSGLSI